MRTTYEVLISRREALGQLHEEGVADLSADLAELNELIRYMETRAHRIRVDMEVKSAAERVADLARPWVKVTP